MSCNPVLIVPADVLPLLCVIEAPVADALVAYPMSISIVVFWLPAPFKNARLVTTMME